MPRGKKKKEIVDADLGETFAELMKEDVDLEFISTGSTVLDLALYYKNGGFRRKKIANPYGRESVGKTLLALAAGGQFQKKEKNADVYVNDVENALELGWGVRTFKLDPKRTFYKSTDTVEGFESHIIKVCKRAKKTGRPAFYILDSIDALDTEMAKENQIKRDKKNEKKKEDDETLEKRNMREKMEKAALLSEFYKAIKNKLEDSDVTLIMISQIRINFKIMFGDQDDIAGGKATKFYASQRMKIQDIGKIKQTIGKKQRKIGVKTKVVVVKNKVQEPYHEAEFPIYYTSGINDIESCVDFLTDVSKELGTKGKYKWKNKVFKTKKSLIEHIEKNEKRYEILKKKVRRFWVDNFKLK